MDRKLQRAYLHVSGFLTLISLFALMPTAVSASLPDSDVIRVALLRHYSGIRQITVGASADFIITRTDTNDRIATSSADAPITLVAGGSGITLKRANGDSADVGKSVTVSTTDAAGIVSIESPSRRAGKYRGAIEINMRSGSLHLVNVVNVEDYLPGSVPTEMPSSFPIEAIKAQVIAARTYALENRGKHSSGNADLCDSTHCQVYGGVTSEKPATSQAVAETKGQVLTYNGGLASALYCADCGGATQSFSDSYSGRDVCYLRSVTEPEGVPHSSWKKTYKLADLAAKLVRAGIKEAEGLKSITIARTNTSGRAAGIEITGAKGSREITGAKLRNIMPSDIKSTLFAVETSPDGTVTFKGKGWGHGIGMCQVGAKGLAAAPFNYSYDKILSHYYPGTSISPLPSAPVMASQPQGVDDDQGRTEADVSGDSDGSAMGSSADQSGAMGSGPDDGLQIRIQPPVL